ncbi:MAG: glycosyltransferase [Thermoplasmata archaeon]|nr:glycosyltransferase [Thermoplasmata archaeon]
MNGRSISVSIVVAVVNEQGNVSELYRRLRASLPISDWELCFVDDGSTDRTVAEIRDIARDDQRVSLVQRSTRSGTASAQYAGFGQCQGLVTLIMDGDLQHRPEEAWALVEPCLGGRATVSVGSRYLDGTTPVQRTFGRALISRGAELAVRLLSRKARHLSDPLSGFFAYRSSVLPRSGLEVRGAKFLYFPLQFAPDGRVAQLPMHFDERTRGQSKILALRGRIFTALFSSLSSARRAHGNFARPTAFEPGPVPGGFGPPRRSGPVAPVAPRARVPGPVAGGRTANSPTGSVGSHTPSADPRSRP